MKFRYWLVDWYEPRPGDRATVTRVLPDEFDYDRPTGHFGATGEEQALEVVRDTVLEAFDVLGLWLEPPSEIRGAVLYFTPVFRPPPDMPPETQQYIDQNGRAFAIHEGVCLTCGADTRLKEADGIPEFVEQYEHEQIRTTTGNNDVLWLSEIGCLTYICKYGHLNTACQIANGDWTTD